MAVTTLFIYAALLLIGGLMGYMKAQSLISLVMGLLSGIAVSGTAFAMMRGMRSGFYSAIALTLGLMVLFHWRYLATGNFMPGALMAIISALTLVVLILTWFKG